MNPELKAGLYYLYITSFPSIRELLIPAILDSLYALRVWVRKFCHRCYNFVNYRPDSLLYYILIERATLLLYNDAKRMHERN